MYDVRLGGKLHRPFFLGNSYFYRQFIEVTL